MLKPLHDYVVLEKVKEEVKTESGIILTTKEAKDEPSLGKVVAVGPGKTEDGKLIPIELKKGEKVIYKKYSGTDVKIDDEIEVEVVKVNDGEGNVLLSQRNIVNRKVWDAIVAAYDNQETVKGVGKEAVKGGLLADVMHAGVWCHAIRITVCRIFSAV